MFLVIAFLLVLPAFAWIAWGAWQDGEYTISAAAAFMVVVLLCSVLGYWRDWRKEKKREEEFRERMTKIFEERLKQREEESEE